MGCLVIIVLFTIAGIIGSCHGSREEEKQQQAASIERERAAKAEAARLAALTPEQREAEARAKANKAKREAEEARRAAESREVAYACREMVNRRLKDPKSAEWEKPWYSDATFDAKSNTFRTRVEVRAKNSFGAYGISQFECVLMRSGTNWTGLSLREIRG
ncbi:MAG: hypothetical protein ACK50D_12075 [Burkholderiales bacterium]|jgi:hypothetical protein